MSQRWLAKSVVVTVIGALASVWMGLSLAATPESTAPVASTTATDSPQYKRGKLLFIQCRACHALQAEEPHKVGPNLHGFVGRKAGTVEGFIFSAALKQSDLTWDEPTILKWLEKPSALVPGNTMAFAGIANPKDRDSILVYLQAETQPK